ncbi:MAG: osmotically inducible protein C [Bacteroidetes bacterium RIFOXYA12_FULL_35_11]|nr:MAG: osmotically inducible protein C [Bacteroidetes bacterium GWF2_35_48]OFY81671.1 MAG: osmotically inducible protein C [Bacteroidetes bacterium RIFOXYA12_FULL_35_11]OFY96374.1 MAG: osmotically inducible protein C [Bacteroidetes bacterium RIFOXYB2_FULL_35_7]OFZ04955.1 MAG: osmotically inducible protein C [Bacteroidetes bacterium RIFOXYC12_FULL_35_7]HBX50245.1 osmotically inducible protein C [Bacteroidales bacterium]
MKTTMKVSWKGKMAFETKIGKHSFLMDAAEENGGENKGPRPKPLMMAALAGCTGMDVVSILKKMRVEIDSFDLQIEGELTEEHPKHYKAMHLVYIFKGKDLPLDKLEKAVSLSQDQYCGVSASYKKAMQVTYEIKNHAKN